MNGLLAKEKRLLFGESVVEDQLGRNDPKGMVNQGFVEMALGVDNHENNHRLEKNLTSPTLLAGIDVHFRGNAPSGICHLTPGLPPTYSCALGVPFLGQERQQVN